MKKIIVLSLALICFAQLVLAKDFASEIFQVNSAGFPTADDSGSGRPSVGNIREFINKRVPGADGNAPELGLLDD